MALTLIKSDAIVFYLSALFIKEYFAPSGFFSQTCQSLCGTITRECNILSTGDVSHQNLVGNKNKNHITKMLSGLAVMW